jgi:signal transduction histidine kinase
MSASEASFLRQLLGAHDASGERLLGRVRAVLAPAFLLVAWLLAGEGTPRVIRLAAALSFGLYATAMVLFGERTRPRSRTRLRYLSVLLDLAHVYALGLSLLLAGGPGGVNDATALWVTVALLNGASVIRGDPRACVLSFVISVGFAALLEVLGGSLFGGSLAASGAHFLTHGLLAALPALVAAESARRERVLAARAASEQQKQDEERARLEWRLKVADRMVSVGTMAAGVAHEVNNPLTYVLGNLDWALAKLGPLPDLDEVRSVLEQSLEGALRVQTIVAALRTFSRVDDGPAVPVDLHKTIAAALTMASSELRHRARVEQDVPRGLVVLGSEAKLGQVFLNLVVNAAQAIEPGNPEQNLVRIRAEQVGDRVQVSVTDTGCGIPAEHVARIFDPFFTTKPVGAGTGLGLSICHAIVTELGGRIELESTVGRGTTFRVWLEGGDPRISSRMSSAPPEPSFRGRVLVVDDERLVAQSLALILGDEHDVEICTSADEALARVLAGERFDALICDLMMPQMTGIELYYELEVNAPELAEHMLFATGGAFTAAAQSFVEKMHGRVVPKPFRSDQLRKSVARMVHHAQEARASAPPAQLLGSA